MGGKIEIIKKLYLIIRTIKLRAFSGFTFPLRRKAFPRESTHNILVIALKRAGDTILSIPTFRAIKENLPHSQLTVFANTYVREILERIDYIDNIVGYERGISFLQKARLVRKLSHSKFDLAVDLTCDYTLEGALLTFLSRARYRVGYNSYGRGLLFNKSVKQKKEPVHVIEKILNITRSINVDTQDKSLRISSSEEASWQANGFGIT